MDWDGLDTPPVQPTFSEAGHGNARTGRRTPLIQRLMAKVSPEPTSGCWLFTGSQNGDGYGTIGRGGAKPDLVLAHRAMFEHHHGPVPAGLVVMHLCDVRCCVNPAHLRAGTHSENNLDMHAKGRHPRRSHSAKAGCR
jgi:hypothetical protein